MSFSTVEAKFTSSCLDYIHTTASLHIRNESLQSNDALCSEGITVRYGHTALPPTKSEIQVHDVRTCAFIRLCLYFWSL